MQPRLRRSLQRRLTIAFLLFGGVVGASYLVVLPRLLFDAEDRVFGRIMHAEIERLRAMPSDRVAHAILPTGMRVFDQGSLPAHLGARFLDASEGVHEWLDVPMDADGQKIADCFVGVFRIGERRHYLLYDVSALETFDERRADWEFVVVIALGFAVCVIGTCASIALTRSVARSLGLLHDVGATATPEEAEPLIARLGDDEIGAVARRFDRARRDLAQALDRERRFTRDASHELRTPVTVVRGALELLDAQREFDPARTRELLSRIESATGHIEDLVVAFLWLARSERGDPEFESFDVARLVRLVIESIAEAERRSPEELGIEVHTESVSEVTAPPRVPEIVVRNLVQNAVRHGGGGGNAVRIRCRGRALSIENALPGAGESTVVDSYGFGLSIVEDLCARFGWTLELERTARSHVVRLEFA